MSEGKGNEVIGSVLISLAEYTQIHFADEEKYFDDFGYLKAGTHRLEHRIFVKTAEEYIKHPFRHTL